MMAWPSLGTAWSQICVICDATAVNSYRGIPFCEEHMTEFEEYMQSRNFSKSIASVVLTLRETYRKDRGIPL